MTELEKAKEKRRLFTEITEKNVKAKNSLTKTKKSSFKEAVSILKLPFSMSSFVSMNEKSKELALTFVFAGVGALIGVGMLFCAVIDLIALALYVPVFPFVWLFMALTKSRRINSFKRIIDETEKELAKFDIKKIESDIKRLEAPKYPRRTSSVEDTEWYKAKCDKYYRKYMGLPPKKYKYKPSDEELKKFSDIVDNQ